MSQLPHSGRHTHEYIDRLIDSRPGLEIRLGRSLERIPQAIRDLLSWPDRELRARAARPSAPDMAAPRPLVSVIIPVYNGARFLADAVGNVLRQRYPAVEIIVVDDGSTDEIDEAVRRLPVDVRYFKQPNAGAASARNRGIKDASGELIAFLDVDDLWPDGNLELLVEALVADPGVDVVQGYAQLTQWSDASGRFEYVGNPRESFPHYIGAALYRRGAFERVGLFDAELRFAEDTDWFTRAREAALRVQRIEQVTLMVRRHGDNMTRGKSLVELNTLRVFKKALDRRRAAAPPTGR